MKMIKSAYITTKLLVLMILINGFKCKNVKSLPNELKYIMDFEQMKNDLFTRRDLNVSNDCLKELNAIAIGLSNSELWAMKSKFMLLYKLHHEIDFPFIPSIMNFHLFISVCSFERLGIYAIGYVWWEFS